MNTQCSYTGLFDNQEAPPAFQPKATKKLSLKREIIRVASKASTPQFGRSARYGQN